MKYIENVLSKGCGPPIAFHPIRMLKIECDGCAYAALRQFWIH